MSENEGKSQIGRSIVLAAMILGASMVFTAVLNISNKKIETGRYQLENGILLDTGTGETFLRVSRREIGGSEINEWRQRMPEPRKQD